MSGREVKETHGEGITNSDSSVDVVQLYKDYDKETLLKLGKLGMGGQALDTDLPVVDLEDKKMAVKDDGAASGLAEKKKLAAAHAAAAEGTGADAKLEGKKVPGKEYKVGLPGEMIELIKAKKLAAAEAGEGKKVLAKEDVDSLTDEQIAKLKALKHAGAAEAVGGVKPEGKKPGTQSEPAEGSPPAERPSAQDRGTESRPAEADPPARRTEPQAAERPESPERREERRQMQEAIERMDRVTHTMLREHGPDLARSGKLTEEFVSALQQCFRKLGQGGIDRMVQQVNQYLSDLDANFRIRPSRSGLAVQNVTTGDITSRVRLSTASEK